MSKLNHLYNAEKNTLLSNASEMGGLFIESLSEYTVVSASFYLVSEELKIKQKFFLCKRAYFNFPLYAAIILKRKLLQ